VASKEAGGERAGYLVNALVYRTGAGVATIQGPTQNALTRESNGTMNCDIDVDGGNNARIRVTGIAATTIDWRSRHTTVVAP
jgi:hypothetical protein